MMNSKAKNQSVKWPLREIYLAFKKAGNNAPLKIKKAKNDYFKEATKYGVKNFGKN